jgi:hypothetical protein
VTGREIWVLKEGYDVTMIDIHRDCLEILLNQGFYTHQEIHDWLVWVCNSKDLTHLDKKEASR